MADAFRTLLARLADGTTLDAAQSEAAFATIMDGQATPAQIGSLLTALHMRGETLAELTGAVRAMRARMTTIAAPPGAIDVCGTGGDGFATLNVSTATAFVVAACGVPVAKHGNRALSSRSGAADVLGELGIDPDLPLERLSHQLAATGLAFLFAPRHHPALRHAAASRAELGFRTIFNLLGPLCNPAGVTRQLTGVYDPAWAAPMAETLGALGTERAWLVHGQGLDELTLAGETLVCEWRDGALHRFTVTPEQAGLGRAPIAAIAGGDAASNARALRALLQGEKTAYRDTVLLNAAATLVIADRAGDLADGAAQAAGAIDSGRAQDILDTLTLGALQNPNSGSPRCPIR
jgi:anthranilate phosphoribosyltransferase/anthranilate synthase/phosphoribosyltransferase